MHRARLALGPARPQGAGVLVLFAACLLAVATGSVDGQAPADVLVIEGGTLIDGNGGAPVRDVQIVVRGNRITAVGRRGAAIPAGARVVPGDGKFIIPGLWDAQLNFYSHHGEAMLNHGVTSFVGIGNNGEVGIFMHEGVVKGRILQPRPWDAPVHFQEFANLNGLESPYFNLKVLASADEAREWTRRILALGADAVMFQTGRAKEEVVRAAFEEGHRMAGRCDARGTGDRHRGGGQARRPGHSQRRPAAEHCQAVPFTLKSITELEVTIDERYLRNPGRYRILVRNPPPPPNVAWGDGRSNVAWLLVAYKDSLLQPWAGTP